MVDEKLVLDLARIGAASMDATDHLSDVIRRASGVLEHFPEAALRDQIMQSGTTANARDAMIQACYFVDKCRRILKEGLS